MQHTAIARACTTRREIICFLLLFRKAIEQVLVSKSLTMPDTRKGTTLEYAFAEGHCVLPAGDGIIIGLVEPPIHGIGSCAQRKARSSSVPQHALRTYEYIPVLTKMFPSISHDNAAIQERRHCLLDGHRFGR